MKVCMQRTNQVDSNSSDSSSSGSPTELTTLINLIPNYKFLAELAELK